MIALRNRWFWAHRQPASRVVIPRVGESDDERQRPRRSSRHAPCWPATGPPFPVLFTAAARPLRPPRCTRNQCARLGRANGAAEEARRSPATRSARRASFQTSSRHTSSRRPARSRATCGCDASRPDGVRHASPAVTPQVGHGRARHPLGTCRRVAGRGSVDRARRRQRRPGAARHSGHHSASHARRSLTEDLQTAHGAVKAQCGSALQTRPEPPPGIDFHVVVCSIGPTDAVFGVRGRNWVPWMSRAAKRKEALLQGDQGVARPGLEPGTPRFSVVCSTS